MVDVPPRARWVLRHERVHAVDRHEGPWPEDLRGEPPPGSEVRIEESAYRLLPPCAAAGRPVRRRVRERRDRSIREPPPRASRQEYLVDGRRRDHRLLS